MGLKFGVALGQNGLDKQLGKGPQGRKYINGPPFLQKKGRDGLIEINALIEEAVVVRDTMAYFAYRRVEFIPDEQSADPPFSHQR